MENKSSSTKKIRKGDMVVAIAGNSRGLTGVVQSRDGDKIIVQGLNVRKKHVKKTQDAPKGRIMEIEKPIHASNLKVYVEGNTAAKLKVRTNEQGDRQLVYKKDDRELVYRSIKKPK
jgi:large subunit ribosomal protein L24